MDLGRYRLVALLGRGGMGAVYRAELHGPSGFRKDLAVKVVRPVPDPAEAAVFEQAFLQEARIGARLKHPNVVDVYDFGVQEGRPWLAMELVPGRSLFEHLRSGPLPPRAAIEAALQIARALAHVQALTVDGAPLEVVHRDLKPSNILLTPYGLVKVMDFGLARPAGAPPDHESDQVRGTISYMAPEQLLGHAIDGRADQFALGLLLFEMLSGQRFFPPDGPDRAALALPEMARVLLQPGRLDPAEAAAPGASALLLRMLAPHPEDRMRRADGVASALQSLLDDQPPGRDLHALLAPPPSSDEPPRWLPPPGSGPSSEPRHNLREEGSALIGREATLQELARLQADGGRLVTLLGPDGLGKSRVARSFAAAALDPFAPGGCWWVDASGAATGAALCQAVASALSLPHASPETVSAALSSGGRLLLIIDALEPGPDLGDLLSAWLNQHPALHLLITSRRRLAIAGERLLELGPLDRAGSERLLRARLDPAARPDPADVDALLAHLDGVPLALELAAARLAHVAPGALLRQLRQPRTGAGSADGDDPSLWGVIRSSWQGLSDLEQQALARCSVFRGGFDLPAAEVVLSDLGAHVPDLLQALRDCSMLRAPSGDGVPRFGLYRSIAAFAADQLRGEALQAAHQRHALHFLSLGEPLAAAVNSPTAREAHARLAPETANLLAIVDRYEDSQRATAARAALVAEAHLGLAGPFDLAEATLRRVHPAPAPHGVAVALALGRLLRRRSRFDEAGPLLDLAIELASADGDRRREVVALCQASALARHTGDHRRASTLLQRAQARLLPDDLQGAGWLCASRALLSWQVEGPLPSAVHHRAALAAWRRAGDLRQLALSLNALGVIEMLSLRFDRAADWYGQALQVHRDLGDAHGESVASANLGALHIQTGDLDAARRSLANASRRNRLLGNRRVGGAVQSNLGLVEALLGHGEAAHRCFDAARTLLQGSGAEPALLGAAHIAHAAFLLDAGQPADAEGLARRAVDVLQGPAGDSERPSARAVLAAALGWQGRFVEADLIAAKAQEEGEGEGAGNARLAAAHVSLARSRWAEALGGDAVDATDARLIHDTWGTGGEHEEGAPVPGVQRLLRRSLGRALQGAL